MDRNPRFRIAPEFVPERSSSRSPEKSGASSLKRLRDLEEERNTCNAEARRQRKKLKLLSSYDAEYWAACQYITDKELQATRLTKQLSIASFKDNTKSFLESELGQRLFIQEKSIELDRELCEKQAQKMQRKGERFSLRRSFVELFIGAQTGWGIKNSRGQRDNTMQSEFRADLMMKLDSSHPDPDVELIWCPITSLYFSSNSTVAAHLFPSRCGQESMEAIFGPSPSGQSELFKAENGMLWSTDAETRFESGLFVIVPDVAEQPTREQITAWEESDPKEYKIRVLDHEHVKMTKKILDTQRRWADLDGQRVQFKTKFRPRARYLYFTYCEAMLRRSFYVGEHLKVARAELRNKFWGTPGRYMLKGMLLGFVEHMGHEYEHLLDGAIQEDEAVSNFDNDTGIAMANACIRDRLLGDEEEDEDEDDDEDDEDEPQEIS